MPAGARVIDLSTLYAIPGLIDAHTHITYWADAAQLRPGVRPTQVSQTFTFDEMKAAVDVAHAYGKKIAYTGATGELSSDLDAFEERLIRLLTQSGGQSP